MKIIQIMKTSNKLLAAAVLLLITAAVVNALTLKSRFHAMMAVSPAELRDFPVASFHTVELSGTAPRSIGKRLHVTVKYAERVNVRYTALDFIRMELVGETLKINVDHVKGYETDIKRQPEIIIECPDLIALTAIGIPLDSLDLPADAHALTRRYYQKSQVTIAGFRGAGLRVSAADGMEVVLDGLAVDSLIARADRAGMVEIRQNELKHASLTVGDEATITLDHTQIGTMSTDVADKGQFIVKGTQLTAHGEHH